MLRRCALAAALLGSCRSAPRPGPLPEAVEPSVVVAGLATPVTILGRGFDVALEADFSRGTVGADARFGATLGGVDLEAVERVSERELTAVVPAAIPDGTLDLVVHDPAGRAATLPAAVRADLHPTRLAIEDASDGSGAEVGDVTLVVGSTRPLFAVGRAPDGRYAGLVDATWGADGDFAELDPAGSGMATLRAAARGSGTIVAEAADLDLSDQTGTVSVVACIADSECADPCYSAPRCVGGVCVLGAADKDSDGDGLVDARCPGGTDCDDERATCGTDCTDADGDGACVGSDCDDTPETGASCSTGCVQAYVDADGDGWGVSSTARSFCQLPPEGWALLPGDCADAPFADAACNFRPGDDCHPGLPDLCNGADDDCDPSTPDGSAEKEYGAPCDGLDTDLCVEGKMVCDGTTLVCDDVAGGTPELCSNGEDDDCDGLTDADDPDCWTTSPGWVRQGGPATAAHDLTAADAVSPTAAWAVGARGTILASTDGGATWTEQPSGTRAGLTAVDFVDAQTGFVVGEHGVVLATKNGGQTWVQCTTHGGDLLGVSFADSQDGVVVGKDGLVLATINGGASWIPRRSAVGVDLRAAHFLTATTGWVVGDAGNVVATTNGGVLWTAQSSGTTNVLRGVFFADPETGWAVGDGGTIVATKDGGATWTAQVSGTVRSLASVRFSDAQNGIIVGGACGSPVVLTTSDGGAHWSPVVLPAAGAGERPRLGTLRGVALAGTSALAVSDGGAVLASGDRGATWTETRRGSLDLLTDLHFVDASIGWVVGRSCGSPLVESTTDGGTTWTVSSPPGLGPLFAVDFLDASRGWVAGAGGRIALTTDGGATWTQGGSGVADDLFGIAFADASDGWATGARGVVLHTTDGGITWSRVSAPGTRDLRRVRLQLPAGSPPRVCIAGSLATYESTADGGATWAGGTRTAGVVSDLEDVALVDASRGLVVGDAGTALATGDGGVTWSRIPVPADVRLRSVVFTGAAGWAAGDAGIVVHTDDGGATWGQQPSGTANDLWAVRMHDASVGWAVGEGGVILKTTTGGH